MNKEQITNTEPSIRKQPSQYFRRQQKAYDPILYCNPRPSNSANYIPTTNSQHTNSNANSRQLPTNPIINTSQVTHTSQHSTILTPQQLSAYQKLSQLTQRLKNIHHFYKLRIQQQRQKNSQRNQVFMSIVEQLQRNHNDRVMVIKNEIRCVEQDRHEVEYVDERVSQIQMSIDELLRESATYKLSNQQLQRQIGVKGQSIRQKQKQLEKAIIQQKEIRKRLQELIRMGAKQDNRQKQMLQMIDRVIDVRR